MKKLSTYLFLVLFSFSAPSFADDIRDYQIEGMSIGDSLLNYFTEEKIKNNIQDIYTHIKDKKFTTVFFYDLPSLNVYETISINIKVNDKKYLIYAIEGEISYEKNISDCYKKLDEVVDELSKIFKDEKKIGPNINKLKFDSSGKSEFTYVFFEFKSGDNLGVACYDYSENVYEEDLLSIGVRTKEFNEWLK